MRTSENNPYNEREFVHCAHQDCGHPAMTRIDIKTGVASICRDHYERHHAAEAKRWCMSQGLDSVSKCKAYVHNHIRPMLQEKVIDVWI